MKMSQAPKDGTRILVWWEDSIEERHWAVVFWGKYHPNSPGKDCWRLDYTSQPIDFPFAGWKRLA